MARDARADPARLEGLELDDGRLLVLVVQTRRAASGRCRTHFAQILEFEGEKRAPRLFATASGAMAAGLG